MKADTASGEVDKKDRIDNNAKKNPRRPLKTKCINKGSRYYPSEVYIK